MLPRAAWLPPPHHDGIRHVSPARRHRLRPIDAAVGGLPQSSRSNADDVDRTLRAWVVVDDHAPDGARVYVGAVLTRAHVHPARAAIRGLEESTDARRAGRGADPDGARVEGVQGDGVRVADAGRGDALPLSCGRRSVARADRLRIRGLRGLAVAEGARTFLAGVEHGRRAVGLEHVELARGRDIEGRSVVDGGRVGAARVGSVGSWARAGGDGGARKSYEMDAEQGHFVGGNNAYAVRALRPLSSQVHGQRQLLVLHGRQ